MAYKRGECWVCLQDAPVQSHHVRPLEYGGAKDGKQIDLCAKDHALAHYEALHYMKSGTFQSPIAEDAEGIRLRKVIQLIVETKLKFDAGVGKNNDDQRRTSQVHWDSEQELTMAHDLKRALKFKSLERMIKAVVFNQYEVQRRKGNL